MMATQRAERAEPDDAIAAHIASPQRLRDHAKSLRRAAQTLDDVANLIDAERIRFGPR